MLPGNAAGPACEARGIVADLTVPSFQPHFRGLVKSSDLVFTTKMEQPEPGNNPPMKQPKEFETAPNSFYKVHSGSELAHFTRFSRPKPPGHGNEGTTQASGTGPQRISWAVSISTHKAMPHLGCWRDPPAKTLTFWEHPMISQKVKV